MDGSTDQATDVPWQQRLLDNIWVLAVAAIVFWLLSYLVWGFYDIVTAGGS